MIELFVSVGTGLGDFLDAIGAFLASITIGAEGSVNL